MPVKLPLIRVANSQRSQAAATQDVKQLATKNSLQDEPATPLDKRLLTQTHKQLQSKMWNDANSAAQDPVFADQAEAAIQRKLDFSQGKLEKGGVDQAGFWYQGDLHNALRTYHELVASASPVQQRDMLENIHQKCLQYEEHEAKALKQNPWLEEGRESRAATIRELKDAVRAETPPPAKTKGLMRQIGPTCWLFVLHAMVDTIHGAEQLGQVLLAAPSEADLAKAGFGKGEKGRRKKAVNTMVEHLESFKKAVDANPKDLKGVDLREAAKAAGIGEHERFASQILMALGASSVDVLAKDALNTHLGKAVAVSRKLQTYLEKADPDKDSNAEANALLGGTGSAFSDDQDSKDIVATLQVNNPPAYVGIRKRFKLNELGATGGILAKEVANIKKTGMVDMSKYPGAPMGDTVHAVLMTSWDQNSVTYQDPNFPSVKITVSIDQFKTMGAKSGTIRPMLPGNKLSDLKDQ